MEWLIGLAAAGAIAALAYLIWTLVEFDEQTGFPDLLGNGGSRRSATSAGHASEFDRTLGASSFDRAMDRIAREGAANENHDAGTKGDGFVLCGTILDESEGEMSEALTFYIRARQGSKGRSALRHLTRQLSSDLSENNLQDSRISAEAIPGAEPEDVEFVEAGTTTEVVSSEPDIDADIADYRKVPVLAFINATKLIDRNNPEDRDLAFRLFNLAGQAGYRDGYVWCGLLLEQDGGDDDLRRALVYYFHSLKGGLGGQAVTQLARHFASGQILEQDMVAAAQCYARLYHVTNVSEGAVAEASEFLQTLDPGLLANAIAREIAAVPAGMIAPGGESVDHLITLVGDVNNARGDYTPPGSQLDSSQPG